MKTSISKPSSDKFANYVGFMSACVLAGVSAFVLLYNNPFKIRISSAPAPLKISLKTFSKPIEKVVPIEPVAKPLPPKPPKPEQVKPKHKKEPKPIKHEPKPLREPKIAHEPKPKQEQIAPTPAPASSTPTPSAPTKQATRHLSMANSANDERFLRIIAAIKKHQHYPKQALKMRKTGIVEVSFILQKDGGVRGIKLLKSSGVNSLDEAALKSVQKASREFIPLDDEYKISLPISFKIL